MKKFLTVLLVIAVMFTFSFGTAMAATYTLDDYASALTAEKTAQLGYMNSAKIQAVNSYTYDEDGFTTDGYMKAAYEAAAKNQPFTELMQLVSEVLTGIGEQFDMNKMIEKIAEENLKKPVPKKDDKGGPKTPEGMLTGAPVVRFPTIDTVATGAAESAAKE